MSLFQNSVVNKYLATQNKTLVLEQWELFQKHFHNAIIQENIRNSKEEQYQGEFLIDLFVNILGFTKNPTPNFNLTTELKNIKDSKKADGAIVINNIAKAVIELKGTNTTDLSKIETQAFGYKNNQTDCVFVITSNFEKLRFYIDNAIEHIEFNLFQLSFKEFELLYLCLAFDNIKNDIPKKIKDESVSQEDAITKKLYKDYSLFKNELYHNLVALNPDYEPIELFKKSQKLLDRFLFIFFAEDRNLLPTNLIFRINKEWQQLQEMRIEVSLYDRYKIYFKDLNTGAKVSLPAFNQSITTKKEERQIFAYNGGLFAPDDVLNNIIIDDKLLFTHTEKMSNYDFQSEVDVNILGHIFENSLNDLDEMKAQLESPNPNPNPSPKEKGVSKRKKDGVFYTPKYITKYIVQNTVGKLCTDKKSEIQLIENDYFIDKKRTDKTKKPLLDKLTQYRNWLLQITIIDPACGSGAFLNEALNFLIAEHAYIDELQAKLFGDTFILSDVENAILENNLFGVDLNNESVEIAKLSLWLRTAQPNRKLNNLNNNIQCGNSLINDPAIAGDKAFDWHKAFPKIFKEKQKQAFHITTAIHDSRTSQRMIDYKVRESRFMGTMPEPQIIPLTEDEELLITQIIVEIVVEDKLNIMAYNICRDHLHLTIVCEEEEVPKIIQKIKAKTARAVNIKRGVTVITATDPLSNKEATEHDPLSNKEATEHDPLSLQKENAPLSKTRGVKQNSLWTQKYGCKEIVDEEQLWNTINYIRTNREKHGLPPLIQQGSMLPCHKIPELSQTYQHAFRPEYNGGFDVVIGNPPYVRQELLTKIDKDFFVKKYIVGNGTADLYVYFYETAINILKKNGILGYITPNKFYKTKYGKELRQFLIGYNIIELIDFFELKVFDDASTDSQILILEKQKNNQNLIYSPIKNIVDFRNNNYSKQIIEPKNLSDEIWVFNNANDLNILNKINSISISLNDYTNNGIEYGIKTGLNEAFIIDEETKKKIISEDLKSAELIKPYVSGTEINEYYLEYNSNYIITTFPTKLIDIEMFVGIKNYFLNNFGEVRLAQKGEVGGRKKTSGKWFETQDSIKYYEKFEQPKIVYIHTAVNHKFYYDEEGFYINNSCYLISNADKFLSVWLNSKIFSFYKKLNFVAYGDSSESGRAKLDYNKMVNVPIPNIAIEKKQPFIEKADLMLSLNKDLQEISLKFQRNLTREHAPLLNDGLPKKLQDWYLLSYNDFLKELEKKKVKLSLSQKSEWETYFETESQKANTIKTQIKTTDNQIDKMVYELYGLTDEEIKIIENS